MTDLVAGCGNHLVAQILIFTRNRIQSLTGQGLKAWISGDDLEMMLTAKSQIGGITYITWAA